MKKTRKLIILVIILAAIQALLIATSIRHNSSAPKPINQGTTLGYLKIIYVAPSPHRDIARLPSVKASIWLQPGAEEHMLRALDKLGNGTLVLIDARNTTNAVEEASRVLTTMAEKRIPVVLVAPLPIIGEIINSSSTKAYPLPVYSVRGDRLSKLSYSEVKLLVLAYVPPVGQRTWSIFVLGVASNNDELINILYRVAKEALQYMSQGTGQAKVQGHLYLPGTNIFAQIDASYDCIPYGSISIRDVLYRVHSNDRGHIWLVYRFIDVVKPGEKQWQTGWLNKVFIQELGAKRYDPSGFLSYYAPSTYLDDSIGTVKVGLIRMTNGTSTGYAWSYAKQGVVIVDESDYGSGVAKWRNMVDTRLAGSRTILLEPGALIRYPRGGEHVLVTKYLAGWAKQDCKLLGHVCGWRLSYCGLVVTWIIKSP